ncbi:MAG: hypothetical protein AAF569_02110 [Pseudomonadota bacterium]
MRKNPSAFQNLKIATLVVFIVSTFVGVMLVAKDAQAIRLTMKRIEFEGTKRTEVLTIINNEAQPRTYRMGWKRMKMTEDKALVNIDDDEVVPGLEGVENMVRFAPRRVTIPPGGSQQVRLMLRKPRDLPEGEYRSHFWVQPEADATRFEAEAPSSPTASAVSLRMLAGITLPVIVRNGNLTATGAFESGSAQIKGDKIEINLLLTRSGNRSLYGDIDMVCSGGGQQQIQSVRGVAVYAEVERRNLRFNMPAPADINICREVTITYRRPPSLRGELGEIIAETSLNLS